MRKDSKERRSPKLSNGGRGGFPMHDVMRERRKLKSFRRRLCGSADFTLSRMSSLALVVGWVGLWLGGVEYVHNPIYTTLTGMDQRLAGI